MKISKRTRSLPIGRVSLALLLASTSACVFWDMSSWSDSEGSSVSTTDASSEATTLTDGDTTNDASDADAGNLGDADAEIPILARDSFSRSVTNGLGDADVGGKWTTGGAGGGGEQFSVSSDKAHFELSGPGVGVSAYLGGVSSEDLDVQVTLATDKLAIGGSGLYLGVLGRIIDVGEDYNGRVVIRGTGEVEVSISKTLSSTETVLPGATAVFNLAPNEAVRARLQVIGKSPTQLRIKAWKATDTEPEGWPVDVTDSSPSLQAKGSPGVRAYLANGTTSAPIVVSVDDFLVRPASGL